MKTVVNKTRRPIQVPLPRGKSLHLGPGKTGQLRDEAVERDAVKKLIAAGDIEVFDGGGTGSSSTGASTAPHEATRGHLSTFRSKRGDR